MSSEGARPISADRHRVALSGFSGALLCVAMALSACLLCFFPIQGQDVWMQLAMARGPADGGSLGHTIDDTDWTSSTWLSDEILLVAFESWDTEGLIALRTALVLLTLAGAAVAARGRAGGLWGVAALAPFALSFAPLFRVDSHLFAWALAVWQFALIDQSLRGRSRWPLFLLPLLQILWANLDELALLGWLLMVVQALGMALQAAMGRSEGWFDEIDLAGFDQRRLREVAIWILAAGLAIVVNPRTVSAYGETISWLATAVGENSESTFVLLASSDRFGRLITFLIVTMIAGVLALGRMNFGAMAVMLAVTALGLWRFSLIVLFAMMSVALVGPALGEALGQRLRRAPTGRGRRLSQALTASAIMLIAAVTWVCFPRQTNYRFEAGLVAASYPQPALDFLRQHRPAGQGFHPIRWGGPVILSGVGQAYTDPRLTLYGPEFFAERYVPVATASVQDPSWQSILRDAGVTWVLISPQEQHTRLLREALLRRQEASTPGDRDWGLVWFDDVAEVYARRDAYTDEEWARIAVPMRPDVDWLAEQSDVVLRRHPEWRDRLLELISQSEDSLRTRQLLVAHDERVGTDEQRIESLRLLAEEQTPQRAAALHSLGALLLREGHAEEAVGALREAVALEPDQADLWEQFAAALWTVRDEEATVAAYRTLLRLEPNNPVAREAIQAHGDGTLWDEHPSNQG